MEFLLKLGIRELLELYLKKEVSPLDVVEFQIRQIEKNQPDLNAVCEKNFSAARALAEKQAAQLNAATSLSSLFFQFPLFGVPFSIKEMIAVEGFHMTAGSTHRKDYVARKNATVVDRFLAAGAIPLCTTNVPEIGFWWETSNPVYGRTNNPFDTSRTSGGSSGGEAALIASGGSFFGVGSDIGGSIRGPSAFCGIAGHKPSRRVIPLTGHFQTEAHEIGAKSGDRYPYTSLGPMARRAADLPLLFDLMTGPDEFDTEVRTNFKIGATLPDVTKLKIYYIDDPVFHLAGVTSPEVSQGVRATADLFAQLGCEVEALNPRLFKNGLAYWTAALKRVSDLPTYEDVLTEGRGVGSPLKLAQSFYSAFKGSADYTLPSLILVLLEKLKMTERDLEKYYLESLEFKKSLHEKLGEDAILLMPTMPNVAPKHGRPLLSPFDFIYAGVFNALEMPATSVPVGRSAEGLPLAVQIIAAPMQDANTLAAAVAIEKMFGPLYL